MDTSTRPKHFTVLIRSAMSNSGITTEQLAARSDYQIATFEKLLAGKTVPGPDMVNLLAGALNVDREDMQRCADQDRAEAERLRTLS